MLVFVAIFWREDYRGGRNAVTHDCRSNTLKWQFAMYSLDQLILFGERSLAYTICSKNIWRIINRKEITKG